MMQEYIDMKQPDPRLHQYVSFIKSGVRIVGCIVAVHTASIFPLAIAFLVAELVGIYEELV
jgi:hypothetical protein